VACVLPAQEQLPVDVGDPVYPVLDVAAIRGLVGQLSAVKPYSEREVRGLVDTVRASDLLSPAERTILDDMARRFPRGDAPLAYLEAEGSSSYRSDLAATAIDLSFAGTVGVAGSLWSVGSYHLQVQGILDMVNPDAFPPFDFTKQFDGFQVWTGGQAVDLSNGENGHLNFTSAASSAVSFDFFDHALNVQVSRVRRDWGIGERSLSLSGTARPIEAFGLNIRPVSWGGFSSLAGTLGDWFNSNAEQKMFSIHRAELYPLSWLYLSAWESVIYAKRLELTYLDPLFPYFFGQQIGGDKDNLAAGADVAVTISPYARLYFSLYIDEISFVPLSTFFTRPENRYAWQAGVKVPLPWPAWSLFVFQYTKIEPYTYTHYLQSVPQYTNLIDTSYTNDGENIGYHLPPNSDELLLRVAGYPVPRLNVAVQYQLIRHGDGLHSLGQIEGEINLPIDPSTAATYPMKNFLNDGIYEWIHIARLDLSYSIPEIHATAWGEYAFVSGSNFGNVMGNDMMESLVGIGVRFTLSGWTGAEPAREEAPTPAE
jgi:hypothetical protein